MLEITDPFAGKQDKTVKGKGKKPGPKQDKEEPVKEQIQSDRKDELVHDPIPGYAGGDV